MAKEHSFDIVSKVDMQELSNAVNMAMKEIVNRFDFKNSVSKIELEGDKVKLLSDDDGKMRSVIDILQSKLIKRGISLKALKFGKVEHALGGNARQEASLINGIESEKAKQIGKTIRDTKMKVQAQIQGDTVRVVAKNVDDLQSVIALLKDEDFGIPIQFVNYR